VDDIESHVEKTDEGETKINIKKVTIPVDPEVWYKLKVYSAKHKIKLTGKAGEIIKEWVDANVSV